MKIKSILLPIIMSVTLFTVGCSSNKVEEPKSQDTKFIVDVEKALEDRWRYVSKVESGKIDVESESKYLKECVNKELSRLEKYEDANFNDARLRGIMLDYLDALNTQLDAVKYYSSDYGKYDDLWTEGYNLRSTAIVELVDDYGLRVDENYLDEIKDNAQVVKENDNLNKEIEKISKSIEFVKVNEEYGYKDYSAVVENTTSVKFDDFYVDVKLIDEDGIIVDTNTVGAQNWGPGEKVKFEFSTDKDFEKMEWSCEYYME